MNLIGGYLIIFFLYLYNDILSNCFYSELFKLKTQTMKKQDEYSSDRDTFLGMFAEIISYLRQLVNKKAKTKNLYDTADVKQLLKASDSTVYRLRKSGKLKFIKIRGRIYYTIASVKKLMKGK